MERNNRTWICSVLFLDIVGYTKLSVSSQMDVKGHFCSLVTEALLDIPSDDCINLDTGDGMAICYLGDPEDILFIGIGLKDAFVDLENTCNIVYKVRLGINLGPVKIVEDINGQRNTIGDGINIAQRIMNFAGDNQLLVSRSFYDVVSCMSDECKNMFHYLGRREDKHVRKHAVYEVVPHGSSGAQHDDMVMGSTPQEDGEGTTENKVDSITEAVRVSQSDTTIKFDEAALRNVEKDLVGYVGPLAKILVKKASKKARSLDELRRMLADEIPTDDCRRQFLAL
jgi:class 3 adenylate cyclase